MSYRCQVCSVHVRGKQLRHVEYQLVLGLRQIAREVPVCQACLTKLTGAQPVALEELLERHRRPMEAVPVETIVPTVPASKPIRWGNSKKE